MRITILALVAATFGALTTTATAATTWTVTETQTQSGHTITQSTTARILSTDADSHLLAVNCEATTDKLAAAFGFRGCFVRGIDGQRFDVGNSNTIPGFKAATGGVVDVPKQDYKVCARSSALFHASSYFMLTNVSCSP